MPSTYPTHTASVPYALHGPHGRRGPHVLRTGPNLRLEITRGRARQPVRLVRGRVYLLGTAADCDLVLGDQRFPAVHSYLMRGPQGAAIRWLGEGPELTVNGQCAEGPLTLEDQDLIRTGSYEFRLHLDSLASETGM